MTIELSVRRAFIFSSIFLVSQMASTASVTADDILKRLEVQVTQSGFAGEFGTLWIIEPSGKWSRQEIVGNGVQPVDSENTGALTHEQLARLIQVLQQNNITTLPEHLGGNDRANPRRLLILWGDKKIEVVTPTTVDPTVVGPSTTNSDSPEHQAAAIARTVQELTKK